MKQLFTTFFTLVAFMALVFALFAVTCLHYQGKIAKLEKQLNTNSVMYQNNLNEVSAKYEQSRNTAQVQQEVFNDALDQVVSSEIYNSDCISDDGRMLLESAIESGYTK